jgi:hypothetical protein
MRTVKLLIAKDFEQSGDLIQVLSGICLERLWTIEKKNISQGIRIWHLSQLAPRGDGHACNITDSFTSFSS